jgi:SAM-dependent methyltransferase
MREGLSATTGAPLREWPGWCCSYCSGPLRLDAHGAWCASEERWFATHEGVHRLLAAERRRELQPAIESYQRLRREEGWRAQRGLPDVDPRHPHAATWSRRARQLARALALVEERIGPGPWRVLDAGAGCCWASARLLEAGHAVAAVDLSLDADDGLLAAPRVLEDPRRLPRAEADVEALPLEPSSMDVVLALGVLHHVPRPVRALLEMRRVTRRGGVVVVLDSPVFRRPSDGEAMVDSGAGEGERDGGPRVPLGPGYLLRSELPEVFQAAGWRLEEHGWPGRLREVAHDLVEAGRRGMPAARFPILIGRRDG